MDVVRLLPDLDRRLICFLKSLSAADWQRDTVAKRWTVKDVVAHLLDGNIRVLSMLRDNYHPDPPVSRSAEMLVEYLNGLNAEWVLAMKRVSPAMLVFLHETTGPLYLQYYASLDPFGKSPFPVSWAGEKESFNWMHIAREYTEKWLHQQQIRDAVGDDELLTRELFYPFIDVFMMALPHTYRSVDATDGCVVSVTISGDNGGTWCLRRIGDHWTLDKNHHPNPVSEVIISPRTAWKLFSKSIQPADVMDDVVIRGNSRLAEIALSMVSVMA